MKGDFNAKTGSDNRGQEEIMGQHLLREMNDDGERFVDLCALNNLVIGRSVFKERIHKATWASPDLSTENQIDRVYIGRKFRRSLQDVCVKHGADVASDHHLFIVKPKLKLKKNWTGDSCQRPRYDITMLLKDIAKQQEFKTLLLNKSQVLEELLEGETIYDKWQTIKESFTSTRKKFWVQKSNTTKNGPQLRPSRRSRREKENRQRSTTVGHELEKPGPMKNVLMQTRQPRRA